MRTWTIVGVAALAALPLGCEERDQTPTRDRVGEAIERGEEAGKRAEERAEKRAEEAREKAHAAAEKARERLGKAGEEVEKKVEESMPPAVVAGAAAHLPRDCRGVAQVDIEALAKLPGATEKLLPALGATAAAHHADFRAMLKEAGIDEKSVKEVAICNMEGPTEVIQAPGAKEPNKPAQPEKTVMTSGTIAVISGELPSGQLVPSLVAKRGFEKRDLDGIGAAYDEKKHLYFAQAKDGAIVISTSEQGLRAATAGDDLGDYPLDRGKALSVYLPREAMDFRQKEAEPGPLDRLMNNMIHATISVAPDGKLVSRIRMPDATQAAEMGGAFKAILQGLADRPGQTQPMAGTVEDALRDGTITYEGNDAIVSATVPPDQIAPILAAVAGRLHAVKPAS